MSGYQQVWREPSDETEVYPGIWVCDDRVSGSITAGQSRLPLWAVIGEAVRGGYMRADDGYGLAECGVTGEDLADFLYCLFEQRGEFGRLIGLLADVERPRRGPWWHRKKHRRRMIAQLQRCIDALEAME